jgi:hypothetical protein
VVVREDRLHCYEALGCYLLQLRRKLRRSCVSACPSCISKASKLSTCAHTLCMSWPAAWRKAKRTASERLEPVVASAASVLSVKFCTLSLLREKLVRCVYCQCGFAWCASPLRQYLYFCTRSISVPRHRLQQGMPAWASARGGIPCWSRWRGRRAWCRSALDRLCRAARAAGRTK